MSPTRRAFSFEGEVAVVSGAGSRMKGKSSNKLGQFFRGLPTELERITDRSLRSGEVGNGRATAMLLARQGAKVVLIDYNEQWAQDTKDMIQSEGGESMVVQADVTNEDSVKAAVVKAINTYGKIDILVNIGALFVRVVWGSIC